MRVLKFNEFILKESESYDYETQDIKNIMGDGYEILAEGFLDSNNTPPTGKILVVSDDDNKIKIAFSDRNGKMSDPIILPKDSIKISQEPENLYRIKIDPNLRWLSNNSNRQNLEDFIEDYINSKIDFETYKTRFDDGIRDDVYSIMDIMGIPCDIKEIKKTEDDNKYEVSLNNGIVIDVKKRSSDDLVGNFDIYKQYSDIYPSVSIKSDSGRMIFTFNQDNLDLSDEIESDITEIGKNDYLNFLLKKSLGLDNTEDEERLFKHFVETVNSREWEYSDLDEKEKQERGRKNLKYLKKLKKLVLSFLPESKVREIHPDKH